MLNTCLMFEFLSSNIFKRNGSYVIMLGSFNDCKVRKHDDLCDVVMCLSQSCPRKWNLVPTHFITSKCPYGVFVKLNTVW